MIDKATVDRIYAAANIVDVISDFVTLKKKGVNYQACCPFHNEKTPSFVVSPSKGVFKCFGCGKGGNAVTFVMEHENMTYPEALKYVAKKYGIEVNEQELLPEEQRRNDDRESMMVVSSYAADYFVRMLHDTSEGQNIGIGYFRERGFSDATIKRFGLGYCTEVRDAFTRQALSDGYKEEFLISTGLTIKRETGGYYDRFCGRVIFPIHSISGRVIAFGARTMRTDKKTAKYLNSPESEIYHKSDVLYGLYFAKRAITQQDCCILVEGYTDVISMHQAGIENVVASSGTSLTQGQIRMIARFSRNITIIYDGDSAGIKASLRGIDMILKEGMNVRTVLLPDGEDPDSFARSHSASQVQDFILAHEEDFISFKIRLLMEEAAGDPIKRAALISDIVQSISVIPDAITRSVYARECSRQMEVDENILLREIAMKRVGHKAGPEAKEFIRKQEILQRKQADETAYTPLQTEAGSSLEELEHELIKYLLKYGAQNFEYTEGKKSTELNVAEVIISNLDQNGITMKNATFRKIYEEYKELWKAQEPIGINHFINHPDPEVCNVVVDMLTYDENYPVSKLWKRFDIVVESEQDRLPTALPRAVILYKSKVIDDIIAELRLRLNDTSLSEEEQIEITQQISILNQERTSISKKLSRLIV
ncbi:MAG TPA: DNA primase [Candidatus Alistipes merdigallinarum]|nr:DNA primase [Candidatus Alistipes merdigallinarum]